jgi:hypothetical protein
MFFHKPPPEILVMLTLTPWPFRIALIVFMLSGAFGILLGLINIGVIVLKLFFV